MSYEMITSVRFCLSYVPLKLDFIAFKMYNISRRNRIVDMEVVNDITCTRQCYYTRGRTIFMTRPYPLNNSDVI